MSSSELAAAHYLIPDFVKIVRRKSSIILVENATGYSVRVSPVAESLLPSLKDGASFEQLREILERARPDAVDIESKLSAFMATLIQGGVVINTQDSAIESKRSALCNQYPLLEINGICRRLAAPLRVLPSVLRRLLLVFLVGFPFVSLFHLWMTNGLPTLRYLMENVHWLGAVAFFLIAVPIHELCHGISCSLSGAKVGKFGIIMHGGLVPGPYVDTSCAFTVKDRWSRFLIPAMGPLCNLLFAGLAALALSFGALTGEYQRVTESFLLVSLLFVFFDTNLLGSTDGSHCLEALVDDELARKYAFKKPSSSTVDSSSVKIYRRSILVYFIIVVTLFGLWWF